MENQAERQKANDRSIWTVDCETDPFLFERVPEPFIWGAYNVHDGEYLEFRTTDEFMAWATTGAKIVYAHNGGKFDWHFIVDRIPLFSRMKVISGRLAKFKIGDCEFRDSWNIVPMPLANYKKDEFDYSKLEREVRDEHMDEIRKYLKNDCVYLAELVALFVENHGTALTLAGAAMKFFEKMRGVKADKTDKDFYDKFAPYYAGGRVQCFERGHINRRLLVADINSAYPEAMTHEHASGSGYAEWDEIPQDDETLQRCFIDCTAESRGAFFYRDEEGGLSFPDDGELRRFSVTGWEYIAARDTGTLHGVEIHGAIEFAGRIEFNDYIDHWYAKKAAAPKKSPDYVEAKNFLVSLYGKYGANPAKYRDYTTIPLDCLMAAEEDEYQLENIEGDICFVSQPTPEAQQRYYNVATAASITGYVRAKLWRAICGAKGVVYCDTDCIVCDDTGSIDIDALRLGAWDIEATCGSGFIALPKMYALKLETPVKKDGKLIEWKIASKGVRLTADEICRVAMGEEIEYHNPAPTFRINRNALYQDETVGYVKRWTADEQKKAFVSRTIRMTRAKQKETTKCPPNRKRPKPPKPQLLKSRARSANKPGQAMPLWERSL